jgi:hypothetical protein
MPLMLSPAGRLTALKKPGWPEVISLSLSCEYVTKTTAFGAPKPPFSPSSGFISRPLIDPKPTLSVRVMSFVNVASKMLMAVCTSCLKLASSAGVNDPLAVVKSYWGMIFMAFLAPSQA